MSWSPHAAVSAKAAVGPNTRIWAYASVAAGAVVGARCTLSQAVHVGPRVRIGNDCKIQNGAQLFTGVTLEDDVFIGPHVVFTNVTVPRAFIDRKSEFKPTLVKRGASIGANATVLCGVTIGEYAMVGAGAVVTHDVPSHTLVVGNPARGIGIVCKCGEKLDELSLRCTACPRAYESVEVATPIHLKQRYTFREVDAPAP